MAWVSPCSNASLRNCRATRIDAKVPRIAGLLTAWENTEPGESVYAAE